MLSADNYKFSLSSNLPHSKVFPRNLLFVHNTAASHFYLLPVNQAHIASLQLLERQTAQHLLRFAAID